MTVKELKALINGLSEEQEVCLEKRVSRQFDSDDIISVPVSAIKLKDGKVILTK